MDSKFEYASSISFRVVKSAFDSPEVIDADFLNNNLLWQPTEYKTNGDKKFLFKQVSGLRAHPIDDLDCSGLYSCPICFEYIRNVFLELKEKNFR